MMAEKIGCPLPHRLVISYVMSHLYPVTLGTHSTPVGYRLLGICANYIGFSTQTLLVIIFPWYRDGGGDGVVVVLVSGMETLS